MKILGHKNINNTLIYTHLMDFQDDEYTSKVAKTVEEARGLVEAGFECVYNIDDARTFRKRKMTDRKARGGSTKSAGG